MMSYDILWQWIIMSVIWIFTGGCNYIRLMLQQVEPMECTEWEFALIHFLERCLHTLTEALWWTNLLILSFLKRAAIQSAFDTIYLVPKTQECIMNMVLPHWQHNNKYSFNTIKCSFNTVSVHRLNILKFWRDEVVTDAACAPGERTGIRV